MFYYRKVLVMSLGLFVAAAQSQAPAKRPYGRDLSIVSNDASPETQLTYVTEVATNDKEMIFLAHNGAPVVRVFDSNGKFLLSFGRKGQGPGEFQGYVTIGGTIADTVILIDGNRNIANYYSSDGKFVRAVQPRGSWADRVVVATLSPDRALVKVGKLSPRPQSKPDSVWFLITDTTGRTIKEVAVGRTPHYFVTSPSGAADIQPQRFLPIIRFATDHSATRGALALPHTYWNGKPGQAKILLVDNQGVKLERIITPEPRHTSRADVDSFARYYSGFRSGRGVQRYGTAASIEKQVRDSLVVPDYLPSVQELAIGRDGSIWVRPYWSRTEWTVFAPNSTRSFTVSLPTAAREIRLFEVSMQGFWTIGSDADDLPVVTRYRFTAP